MRYTTFYKLIGKRNLDDNDLVREIRLQINNETRKALDTLNYIKVCKGYEIKFIVHDMSGRNVLKWNTEIKMHSFKVEIWRGNRKLRDIELMDLPRNVKRYAKLFYKIGNKWIMNELDIDWAVKH